MGVDKTAWRGASVEYEAAPLVCTRPISSHSRWPSVKGLLPKSTATVNRPLLTLTALLVTGPETRIPPVLVLNNVKVRS